MAALAGIKLDEDGNSIYATNCFPVRNVLNREDDGGGAWSVSHRAEQRRRFKAVLCTKPRTYSQIKEERKKTEHEGTTLSNNGRFDEEEEEDAPVLDGFFLMKHCCVEDPSDLCSVNISGQGFSEVKDEDLALFDNVAYVNAAENYLPFEAFRCFPILRELEVPLNGLRSLKFKHTDYPTLELLDLSYNNLSEDDILTIGILPALKVLHLTGNGFSNLPHNFCLPFIPDGHKSQYPRYAHLEVLMLDDNKLSDINIFAAIAGLQKLKHLNLEKNQIFFVPQLKSVQGEMKPHEEPTTPRSRKRKTPRDDSRSTRQSKSQLSDETSKVEEYIKIVNLHKEEIIPDSLPQGEIIPDSLPQGEIITDSLPQGEAGADSAENPIKECITDELRDGEKKSEEIKESDKQLLTSSKNELLDEDFEMSLGDLSARINDLNLEADINGTPSTARKQRQIEPISKVAFPELRYLSLAYNQIVSEEALLAVAAWPMLAELVIHDNPLTTDNVGDPPLLKRFLHDRLRIKLVRKRIPAAVKKSIEMPDRPSRKVKSQVPKIPRPTVEQRLMLEAPKPPPALKPDDRPATSGYKSPLPPIETQHDRATSAGWLPRQQDDLPPRSEEAWSSDVEAELDADTFFMTQVDDQAEEVDEITEVKMKKKVKKLDERYRGFEDLLPDDEQEFDAVESSNDIQTNIRALRQALNHELIYRDTNSLQLDSVKKSVKAYRRVPLPPPKPRPSRKEKVENILQNLRDRNTVNEASLQNVLNNKKMKNQFPEAETLLAQIQHRYNAVRVTSMKEAKDAKKAVQDTLSDISGVSKRSGVKVHH